MIIHSNVPVAQWIARWTSNPKVVGSNPTRDETYFAILYKKVCSYTYIYQDEKGVRDQEVFTSPEICEILGFLEV